MDTPERVAVLEPDDSLCRRIFGIVAKYGKSRICSQYKSYEELYRDKNDYELYLFNEPNYMRFLHDEKFSSFLADCTQRSFVLTDDNGGVFPIFALRRTQTVNQEELSDRIEALQDEFLSEIFLKLGFRHSLTGCRYLKEAIKLASRDSSYLNKGITKRLYPKLAEIFDTTPSNVERGIRHTLSVCFDAGRFKSLSSVFGNCFNGSHCPTNGEFIALVADMLSTKIKNHFSPRSR